MKYYYLLILISFSACLENQEKTENRLIVVTNANIINVETGQISENQSIYISNGQIDSIVNLGIINKHYQIIDAENGFIIPGLIDSHVHATAGPPEQMLEILKKAVKGGVTSIRDMGGDGIVIKEWQNSIENRYLPNIYFSTVMAGDSWMQKDRRAKASSHGGIPGEQAWLKKINRKEEIESAIVESKKFGATGIKIYADVDKDLLPVLTSTAKEFGLKVWSHATIYPAGPMDVIKSGVEVVSHAEILLYHLNEKVPEKYHLANLENQKYASNAIYSDKFNDLLEKMVQQKVTLDATLFISKFLAERDGGNQKKLAKLTYSLTRLAHQKGVKIVAGTDALMSRGKELPNIHEELFLLVNKAGFTNLEALRSATILPAQIFGINEKCGSIKKGKMADLIVLKENPLENIRNTRIIKKVIKAGIEIK